jgi:hypothetical protein
MEPARARRGAYFLKKLVSIFPAASCFEACFLEEYSAKGLMTTTEAEADALRKQSPDCESAGVNQSLSYLAP